MMLFALLMMGSASVVMTSCGDDDDENDRRTVKKGTSGKSATPMLDSFGKDLTKMAAEGKIDPVVGRQKELERIARQDPEKLETPDVNRQIDDIFDEIGNEQWFLDKESWDKDIAAVLKERLLGKTCTITKYNYSTHKFEPLLEQGKPVVRPLTEADIDTFGALIFKETFMG